MSRLDEAIARAEALAVRPPVDNRAAQAFDVLMARVELTLSTMEGTPT